jgi:monoamine oxidase
LDQEQTTLSDRRAALVDAEKRASTLFGEIERRELIKSGRTEREVEQEIYALALQQFGVEKHWHKRIVRAGANTLTLAADNPPIRRIEQDDIVHVDLGPVFEDWEADLGRTYVLGNHPGAPLVETLPVVFDRVQSHYQSSLEITGEELYAFAQKAAAEAGWSFGGVIAGHLVREFAHAHIPGDKNLNRIQPDNPKPMRDPDELGRERHWILEIHLVEPNGLYGGFYERLLRPIRLRNPRQSTAAAMTGPRPQRIVVVGAGAAGLMAARELARAGQHVTILEARDRFGGRILPLPVSDFGYPAEAGAEFIHGEAPVTRGLLREAGLRSLPIQGTAWTVEHGSFSRRELGFPNEAELRQALGELKEDLTLADFLRAHFSHPGYDELRRSIERMVEGYDAADPKKISVFALRDEWIDGGRSGQARPAGGYGPLIDFLAKDCGDRGADIHFNAVVTAVESADGTIMIRCADGSSQRCDCAVLAVPIPLLQEIAFPGAEQAKVAAAAGIGFGNVIKILLRFRTSWWREKQFGLADPSFLISDAPIPTWWTQQPDPQSVLTGWFGGPKTAGVANLGEPELIELGVGSLASIFDLDPRRLTDDLIAARAIDWARDPFARGAYSYATPQSRASQSVLAMTGDAAIFFAGEALYHGPDMGTVEAALVSGRETARAVLLR